MKKTIISGMVISVMAMSMGAAMASSMSSELSVKGKVAIPSCSVMLTKNGVYDLGKIARGTLDFTNSKSLNAVTGDVTVLCEASTFLNFSVVDNREGTASAIGSTHFGLGNVNGTGKLGYYKMKLFAATVDTAASSLYSENKGSKTVSALADTYLEKGKVTGWANANNTQANGTLFRASLAVEPVLASLKDMAGSPAEGTKLDGSATLSFSYAL